MANPYLDEPPVAESNPYLDEGPENPYALSPHGEISAAPTVGESLQRAAAKTWRETWPQTGKQAWTTPLDILSLPLRSVRDVYHGLRYGGEPGPDPQVAQWKAEEQAFRESRAMPGAFDKVFPAFTPEDIAAHAEGAQGPAAVIAATWNAAREVPRFFTTLPGVATLATGGVLGAGPAAMQAIGGRVIAGGFAADLASGLPAQLAQSRKVLADPKAGMLETAEAVVNPYMTTALIATTARSAMKKRDPEQEATQDKAGREAGEEMKPFVPPPVESLEQEAVSGQRPAARPADIEKQQARDARQAEKVGEAEPPVLVEPRPAPVGPTPEEVIAARQAADLAQHEAHLAEGERLRQLAEAELKKPIGEPVTPPPAEPEAPAPPVKLFDPAAAGGALARLRAKAAEARARAEAPPPAPDRELVVDPAEAAAARAYRERVAAEEAAQRQAEAEQPTAPERWQPPRGEPVEPVPAGDAGYTFNQAVRDAGGLTGPHLDGALAAMRKGRTAAQVIGEFAKGHGEYDALANVLETIADARDSGRMSDYARLRKAYLKTFPEGPRKADLTLEGLREQHEQGTGAPGGVPENISELIDSAWREATGTGRAVDHDATAMAQAGADYEAFTRSLNVRGNTIHSGEQALAEVRTNARGGKFLVPTAEGEALEADYQNAVMQAAGIEVEHGMTGAGGGEMPFTNAARQQQFDPTILRDLTAVAGDIIEGGAVDFPSYARAMHAALAGEFQQYYHAAYNQVREFTEAGQLRARMTPRDESEHYDPTGQLTQQPGTAGGGPELPGAMGGAGGGRRPGLRVVDEGDLPTPRSYVRSGEYTGARGGGIDETQRFAVNLALGSFDLGKPAFLLGDGTGVGKTGTELAIAHQQTLRTKLPSLIVTESRAIIENRFKEDATKLGIPVQDIRFATYTDLSLGKLPPGEFGVVIWDEAHNLKNAGSARASLSKKVNARQQVFATATPMDSPTHAAYFLAQLTGKSREQIAKMLGYHFEEREVLGKLREFAVLDKDTDWHTVVDRIRDLRLRAVQGGQFIRREYPFYGRAAMREAPAFSPDQLAEQKLIERHWDDQIDHARSPQMRRNLAGQKTHELSRWAEIQKLPFITESLVEDLAMGKRVVVFAEGYAPTYIKGAGKTVPGLLGALATELDRRGIRYAKVFEDTGKEKARAAADFQKDNVKVLLATPRSGGAGLDMDDQIGNRPRQFYAASLNFSAAQFDQMLGRGSRRNTASPAEFHVLTNRESFADRRRIQIADKKLRVLRNIQAGRDLDTSEFERTAGEQEHGMFEGEFSFDQPEGVTQQRARLEQDAKAKAAQTAREEMARRAGRRLTGDTGDLGQGDLLERPEDLFAPPSPGATVREHGYGESNPDLRGREQRGDPAGWQLPGEGKQPEQADLYLRHALRNRVSEAATVQLRRASAASSRKNQLTQAFPRTAEGGLDFRRAPIPLIDAVFKAEQEHLDALRGYWDEVNKSGVKHPSHASFLARIDKADFEHARDSIRAALKSTSKHPDDVKQRDTLTNQWLGLDELNRRATDELFNDAITAAVETEHGFTGDSGIARDLAALRAVAHPQGASETARDVANTLRHLTAEKKLEMQRAERGVATMRRDFDRTPPPINWRYDPANPLPRNFEFINAIQTGDLTRLSAKDKVFAATAEKMVDDWTARIAAQEPEVVKNWVEHYFPQYWDRPDKAASLFSAALAKRPLEGGKSFLKRRIHELFTDGLAAGLKPADINPADFLLRKKMETEQFLFGRKFMQQAKDAGQLRFKYWSRQMEGYRAPKDPAFQQWLPPMVTVKEAFDAGMRQDTLDVLAKLGVPHERVTQLGKEWGKAIVTPGTPGSERIQSRFGGPDFVLWHELGHVLDNRYADFRPTLTATDVMQAELARLADQRLDASATPKFRRYVQTMPEKMAVALQAYLHTPELMERLAPTVKRGMEGFLNSHPELQMVKDISPSLRLGVGEAQMKLPGMVRVGEWVLPDAAAQVVDNFLSPGLQHHAWYRGLRETQNFVSGIQLVGGFHLGFVAGEAPVNKLALAARDASLGAGKAAVSSFLHAPFAPVTNILTGRKLIKEARTPGSVGGEYTEAVQQMLKAGGRFAQDSHWQTGFSRRTTRALAQAWTQLREPGFQKAYAGSELGKAIINLPFAAVEQAMRPVMEYFVPAQKAGAAMFMMGHEKLRNPGMTLEQQRELFGRVWDSVDNRMGQVTYDNQMLNNALKNALQLTFRSFGWQEGKYFEGLGGAKDLAKLGWDASKGKWTGLSHRSAYLLTLPLAVAMGSTVATYLLSGQKPEDWLDYMTIRTGEKDKNGNWVRINPATYMRDVAGMVKHPVDTIGHSLNPMFSMLYDLWQNRDFYNVQIRNPDDSAMDKAISNLKFVGHDLQPFFLQQTAKMTEQGNADWQKGVAFFGFTPASERLSYTPAQELMAEITSNRMPRGPRTQVSADASKMVNDLVLEFRKAGTVDERWAKLTPGQFQTMTHKLGFTPFEFQAHMASAEDVMRVWRVASPAERRALRPIAATKVGSAANSKNLPPEKVDQIRKWVGEIQAPAQ